MTYRFKQCVNSIMFKYFNDRCPNYLPELSLMLLRTAIFNYLKILSRANSLIANNNIRSFILEIKNDRCKKLLILLFPINIQLRVNFQKLKCLFSKTNNDQIALSYIGLILWIKIPDTLKRTKNLVPSNTI